MLALITDGKVGNDTDDENDENPEDANTEDETPEDAKKKDGKPDAKAEEDDHTDGAGAQARSAICGYRPVWRTPRAQGFITQSCTEAD